MDKWREGGERLNRFQRSIGAGGVVDDLIRFSLTLPVGKHPQAWLPTSTLPSFGRSLKGSEQRLNPYSYEVTSQVPTTQVTCTQQTSDT